MPQGFGARAKPKPNEEAKVWSWSSAYHQMASTRAPWERVTVTMPAELVAGMDRYARNRSGFIAEAVRHELKRRRRLELQGSLDQPHPESLATESLGLTAWRETLPTADSDLLDPNLASWRRAPACDRQRSRRNPSWRNRCHRPAPEGRRAAAISTLKGLPR
jgi:hypothetical protein